MSLYRPPGCRVHAAHSSQRSGLAVHQALDAPSCIALLKLIKFKLEFLRITYRRYLHSIFEGELRLLLSLTALRDRLVNVAHSPLPVGTSWIFVL